MLNVKLSNSQLINKLKSAIKNVTGVTLNLSSNIISDSNDENNFPHKLLANTLRKGFSNGSSANIGFLIFFFNIGKLGGCLGRLLGPLLKSVLIPLRLTAVASAEAANHKGTIRVVEKTIRAGENV